MAYSLGIIGAGRIAREHARAATAVGVTLEAVCDIDGGRARAFAAEHPGAVPISSLDELLANDRIGAVVVAVPNAAHADVAIAALRAGKHVLLEKPMAITLEQCERILNAMNASGRILQLGFVCRGVPKIAQIREMIRSGQLGTIYQVRASLIRRRGIPGLGRWFTTRSIAGGGVLIDLGVHLVDIVMHLLDERRVETVSASCERQFGSPISKYVYEEMWAGPPNLDGTFDVEDSATALIRFASGTTFNLDVAWASNLPERTMRDGIVLLGDRGGCFFDLWGDTIVLTTVQDGTLIDQPLECDHEDAWNRAWEWQHRTFMHAVCEGSPPSSTAADGLAVQQVIDGLYRSSADRHEVAIHH